MARLLELLGVVWLPGLLFAAGLAAVAVWFRRRSAGTPAWSWLLVGSACALAGLGGLTLPSAVAFWLAVAATGLLFAKLVFLVVTGHWYAPLGFMYGGFVLFGLGGWLARDTGIGLVYFVRTLWHSEFAQP